MRCRIVAFVCALLGAAGAAHAQSAVDGFDPGTTGEVNAIVVQPDGKLVVAGNFVAIGNGSGGPGTIPRQYIARLNSDGSVDGFDPHADSVVFSLALQPDGKILVGGIFSHIAGAARSMIARLNADGSIDNTFNPGADGIVEAIAVQSDGKIVVGGRFTHLGSGATIPRSYIGRLNTDATIDASFAPDANGNVLALALQPDGKILAGGQFTTLGGASRRRIGRLNTEGSIDPIFDPDVSGAVVYSVAVENDGRILIAGDLLGVAGDPFHRHLARLCQDGVPAPGLHFPVPNSSIRRVAVEPGGGILIGGTFSTIDGVDRLAVARFTVNGSLDSTFNPGARFGGGSGSVNAIAVQSDARIVVGGMFTNFGNAGTVPRFHIARVYAMGALDTDFDPNASAGVTAIAVQSDDSVLVGGAFLNLGGVFQGHLGRLRADGSVDASWVPVLDNTVNAIAPQPDGKFLVGGSFLNPHPYLIRFDGTFFDSGFNLGLNGEVSALAVQADGKILVGGAFSQISSTGRSRIARLNADGSLDMTFNPGANGRVTSFAVQPDGRIIVAGEFTMIGGGGTGQQPLNYIARLNASGSVDHSFDGGANGPVFATALQPDGSVIVGGFFTELGGEAGPTARKSLGRLTADGLVDPAFDVGANGPVIAIALQIDGGIVIGGSFSTIDSSETRGISRRRIARLASDGSLDGLFDPGANGLVRALAIQPDGKILVGGDFTMLGGGGTGITPRNRIGRLTNTGPAFQELTVYPSGHLTWTRSGTGPELLRVTFESSANGSTYSPLGTGERTSEGWQLSTGSLTGSLRVYVRAAGFFPTGQYDGSASTAASVRQAFFPIPFTDDPIVPGVTPVYAIHLLELRTRIDALLNRFNVAVGYPWSSTLIAGQPVLASHIAELRSALQQAYNGASHPLPPFTDPVISPQTTIIRAVHLRELRAAIALLESS